MQQGAEIQATEHTPPPDGISIVKSSSVFELISYKVAFCLVSEREVD
jgi:hypothetical protein